MLGNIWSRFSNPQYDSMLVTYREVFKQVYLFGVPDRGNIIFLAIPYRGALYREELAQKATAVSLLPAKPGSIIANALSQNPAIAKNS